MHTQFNNWTILNDILCQHSSIPHQDHFTYCNPTTSWRLVTTTSSSIIIATRMRLTPYNRRLTYTNYKRANREAFIHTQKTKHHMETQWTVFPSQTQQYTISAPQLTTQTKTHYNRRKHDPSFTPEIQSLIRQSDTFKRITHTRL